MTKAEAKRNLERMATEDRNKKLAADNSFYSIRSLMGYSNKAIFYILLGGRDYGKSYAVENVFLHDWKAKGVPFWWLRLNEKSTGKLLANDAEKLIDPDLRRSYGIRTKSLGNDVYEVSESGKKLGKMADVRALSTYYNDKGVALFDKDFLADRAMHYNICIDEFQPEKNQKSQGDVAYQFVNQLENIVRDTKTRLRIFLCANTLEEASDVLCLFDFIPEEFGRYWIGSKKAVIDYMEPTEEYLKRRKGTVADILMPRASTFTNRIEIDKTLVVGSRRLVRPTMGIRFYKGEEFTVWDGNVIADYNGERIPQGMWVAMRPYQDLSFMPEARDAIVNEFDTRCFLYKHLITLKKFQKCMMELRPRK